MKLRAADVRPEVTERVARSVADHFETRGFGQSRAFDQMSARPTSRLALPHVVYFLGLDDLQMDAPLDRAEPAMLRYLVAVGSGFGASAELALNEVDDPEAAPDISETPLARSTERAVREAEQIDSGRSFEVRLLRVPALQATALWLHSDEGDDDLFRRLDPFAETKYLTGWLKFVEQLQQGAKSVREMYDNTEPHQTPLGG